MSGEVRPIAMGVGGIKFGTVGDGVPGADLKEVLHLTLQIQRK